MSDFLKADIRNFKDIGDLASYFINEIDSNIYKLSSCSECSNCYERKVRHCATGCMGFKEKEIRLANEYFANLV